MDNCSMFKMLQHVWSQGPGNLSVVCLGWCIDNLQWLVIPQRVQYKLAVTVHRCLRHRAPWYLADCCVPVSEVPGHQRLRSARCHQLSVSPVRRTAVALLKHVHFLFQDQQSGIHCLIIGGFQLLTPNHLGGTWRPICSSRSFSNRALQIDILLAHSLTHSLTYLLTTTTLSPKKETKMFFLISFIKLGRFLWNLVHSFLNRFAVKSRKRFNFHLTWIRSLHYLVKLEMLTAHVLPRRCQAK